jgi:hypothetical protein
MTDIIIFDQLADIKRLTVDEAFIHLEKRFQKERARYLSKMLDGSTSPEETLALKAVVNALEGLSPLSLAEKTLKIEVKNRKVQHPELFKIRKNATG